MTALTLLRSAGIAVLDLVYPPRCALCGRGGDWLCGECVDGLPRADGRRCLRCWMPLVGPVCDACAEHPLVFDGLRAAFRYVEGARRLVHALKFGGQSVLAAPLGRLAAERMLGELPPLDIVVPVPLAGARRRSRGYNQALGLARGVADVADLLVVEALRRVRSTRAQAASASADERRSNVANAFAVRDAALVDGRAVLLIDDVATTGATLDACARPLLAAGASAVWALTFARED